MNNIKPMLVGLLFALTAATSIAQSTTAHKISGKVADAGGQPIATATITLHKKSDSTVLKMAVSNREGIYEFEQIAKGDYLISATAIGFERTFSDVTHITDHSLLVPVIRMNRMANELKAVAVVGRKPMIETKIDRTILNVDAAVSNVGATALEVLEKAPGVTVDKDGNISLKGRQGVQVFIDGKPAYLSGAELVNLLRNMNASQLEQVEIMTNPPAKYDAAGNSGIINLKTKKNKQKGFNGSATAGFTQGHYLRTNESVNLNYRNGKINTFLNYSSYQNNGFQELNIERIYKKEDGKTVDARFQQTTFMPRKNSGNNLKWGLDYSLNKKSTLGFVVSGFYNPDRYNNSNQSFLKDANDQLDSMVLSSSLMTDRWKNGNLNLNYRIQIDSTGKEFSADFDYSGYASNNKQQFINTSYNPAGVKMNQYLLNSDIPVHINIYSMKMDYVHPLKKGAKLETGVKSSYVETDNNAAFVTWENGAWVNDENKTNHFDYKENINAAYMNYSRTFGKLGVQAGLRLENTQMDGHQLGNSSRPDSSFKRSYTNLFPTAFFSYEADSINQFGLSIGRRIDRPAYQDLNPFVFFIDNYTYQVGNPYIRPQYTINTELSHTYKGKIVTTVNYSRTNDYANETFDQQGYATVLRQGNIGVYENTGISVSAQITITKWWNASVYSNFNYNRFKGNLYGAELNVEGSNLLFNVNNQFKFEKGWSAELSGFYRTKGVDGQILINPLGQLSGGISKQVLKGKGSIRFVFRDLLYTNRVSGDIIFKQTEAHFNNHRDSRVAGFTFTYRFGKPIKNASGSRKTGGAQEEKNRVKSGGDN